MHLKKDKGNCSSIVKLSESNYFNACSTRLVRSINAATSSRSGRKSKIGSAYIGCPDSTIGFNEFRNVLRRWLKAVFTTVLKSCSLQSICETSLRVKRITAD